MSITETCERSILLDPTSQCEPLTNLVSFYAERFQCNFITETALRPLNF